MTISSTAQHPQLSIIIVSYNCCTLLRACLLSLRPFLRPERDEVIVVDNNSSDHTTEMLASEFSEVRLVLSGSNLGFGRANILGMQHAKGQYVFMLNPDTEINTNVLDLIINFFETPSAQNIGVIGFQLIDGEGKPNTSAGNFPDLIQPFKELLPGKIFPYRLRTKPTNYYTEVDYVSGADLAFPRKVWEETKGFDPDFFLYYEETEWQYRVMKAGYKRVLLPNGSITHHNNCKSYKHSLGKIRVFERSRILYYQKVYGRLAAWYARSTLSLFYGTRYLLGKSNHFAQSAREVWYV